MGNTMKWKYDKTSKNWKMEYEGGYFKVSKLCGLFFLNRATEDIIGSFNKLSSAKKVAELLING
jgi:hypothetical protein